MTPDEVVTVKEHLKKIIELEFKNILTRLDSMDRAISKSEKAIEDKLKDYPEQFVRIAAMTEIKAEIQILSAEMDKRLGEMNVAIQKMDNLRANINGRLFALGAGGLILITALEFVNHYVFKVR